MTQLSIPIAKGGKAAIFTIDAEIFSELPGEVQLEIIGAGLEKFLNAGMSSSDKFPAPTKLEGEALEKAKTLALTKAEANLKDLQEGKIKVKYDSSKVSAKPTSAEDRKILSRAKQLAIAVLKNRARAQGIKPLSAVPASKWTELALQEIKDHPKYYTDAKAALAAEALVTTDLDLSALIVLDPVKVEKAKAKSKANKAEGLSAKQAGLPGKPKGKVPPARPAQQTQPAAH